MCRYCGGNLVEGPGVGPHWKCLRCVKCLKNNAWLAKPTELQDHGAFVMPFGMHKDKTLAKIASTERGAQYLGWMARELKDGNIKRHIQAFLQPKLASLSIDRPDQKQEGDPRLDTKEQSWDENDPPF